MIRCANADVWSGDCERHHGTQKYPRTRHLEGSRLQSGDLGDDKPLAELAGYHLVVEEKIDGANCAISFGSEGEVRLQSRGHYLTGGYRERHFDLLKNLVLGPRQFTERRPWNPLHHVRGVALCKAYKLL